MKKKKKEWVKLSNSNFYLKIYYLKQKSEKKTAEYEQKIGPYKPSLLF